MSPFRALDLDHGLPCVEGLAHDAPRTSIEALFDLPEYPNTTTIDADRWRRLAVGASGVHPATAEFSLATSLIWGGGYDIEMSRIAGVGIIEFTDLPNHATLVPMPGAVFTPSAITRLASFLNTHQVRLLTAPACEMLAPVFEHAGFDAVEQPDDSDFLFDNDTLAELSGPELKSRRKEARQFERRWGDAVDFRIGRMSEPWAGEHLRATARRWVDFREQNGKPIGAEIQRELAGIAAWPTEGSAGEVRLFALSIGGEAIGASVIESMWGGVQMGIVMKTDLAYKGVTPYLRRRVCEQLKREFGPGCILNIQQSAGSHDLHRMKTSYRPLRMEPKFSALPRPRLTTVPSEEEVPCMN